MKSRREEMRNVWCNEGSPKGYEPGSMQELPPYHQSGGKSPYSSASSPPQLHHSGYHHLGNSSPGFSLIPSLNMASLDKDDIAEESRDSESPISDVEITDDWKFSRLFF